MSRFLTTIALSSLTVLTSTAAVAKEFGKLMPPAQDFELLVDTQPADGGKDEGVVLNKTFNMTVKVNPISEAMKKAKFTDFTFDAKMLAHKHGMVTKPKITETAPLTFRIEGVKLHMAGDWELYMGLKAGELPVKWTIPTQVK